MYSYYTEACNRSGTSVLCTLVRKIHGRGPRMETRGTDLETRWVVWGMCSRKVDPRPMLIVRKFWRIVFGGLLMALVEREPVRSESPSLWARALFLFKREPPQTNPLDRPISLTYPGHISLSLATPPGKILSLALTNNRYLIGWIVFLSEGWTSSNIQNQYYYHSSNIFPYYVILPSFVLCFSRYF